MISSAWTAARVIAAECLSLTLWAGQSYGTVRSHTKNCTFTNNERLTEQNAQDKPCFYSLGKNQMT